MKSLHLWLIALLFLVACWATIPVVPPEPPPDGRVSLTIARGTPPDTAALACVVRGEIFDGGDLLCTSLATGAFLVCQDLVYQEYLRCKESRDGGTR